MNPEVIPLTPQAPGRRRLWRFTGWLACCQALVMMLIGSLYMGQLGWPSAGLAQLYSVTAFVMHFAMLAFVPWLLLTLPLLLILPRRKLVQIWAVFLFALSCAWLLLDGLLYAERQFHINALTMQILGWHTWAFGVFYLVLFSVAAGLLAKRIWAWTARSGTRHGKWVVVGFVVCYLCSQLIHAWADASYYTPVTRVSYTLPLYHPLTAKKFLNKHGLVDMNQIRERRMLRQLESDARNPSSQLNYPLAPLSCQADKKLNLLVILVDAMRADLLVDEVTPNITDFSRNAGVFTQHFSGGNSSRIGVFSLFYGLPANYWKVFEAHQRTPVMMDQLKAQNYQLGIFGSAPLYRPVSLDRTVFADLKNLQVDTPSETGHGWDRDRVITDEWLSWLDVWQSTRSGELAAQQRQQKLDEPFFGFLFYDAPTSKSYPPDYQAHVDAWERQGLSNSRARYTASVRYNDALIKEVLTDLERRNLLDSTVVMISADHGHEFDDSGQGFNGHGSAYNQYQLQVPFVLHWPGEVPAVHTHRTAHTDWVTTVMQKLLGCRNPPDDYVSRGKDLFQQQNWPWLLAGSYHNFAVVSPEQTIVSHLNGTMEVRDKHYQLIDSPELDTQMITDALQETSRFFKGG